MDKQTKIGFLFMIFLAVALFVSAEVSALELNSAIRVDYSPNDIGVKDMKEKMGEGGNNHLCKV